ncbi:MAG: alpha/beta hydrolase [Ilumatobacter sp.]|uniref:alpha/beta fold hydrolase n=1 Tax=Ilumatobacter sp. TaxID=1967498 RepID=UPI003299631D
MTTEIVDHPAGDPAPESDPTHCAAHLGAVAVTAADADVPAPDLPPGRFVDLPGRGTIVVRDFGPRDAETTILLLHGWTATADLNWFRCYSALAEHHRVVAFDHRGHGSGLRSKKRFRLEDCADDAVAVADALGIERFVPVGYSMGGPVAQLIWRRHAERINGLVLCATAPIFNVERAERLGFLGGSALAAIARITPEQARVWLTDQLYLQRKSKEWEPWAIREASSHDWRMLLEAGAALGTFDSTSWIGEVDVPVSLVITTRDPVVSRRRQTMLFELIPDADVYRVDGDHGAVVEGADRFVPALLRALSSVEQRRT